MIQNKGENVGGAIKWVISRKIAVAHVTTSPESAATWVILRFVVTPSRTKDGTLVAVQVVVVETHKQNPVVDEEEEIQRNVTYTTAENRASSDDFYVFNAVSTDEHNTMELMIEHKHVNIVDSGASCNLMSEEMFNFVTGGNARLLECNKRVYSYASVEPLQLKGKYSFNVQVPQTPKSLYTEF